MAAAGREGRPTSLATAWLAAGACLSLVGWGMLHLFWDPPYRSLLWSEPLLRGVVEGWAGISWAEWVGGERVEAWFAGGTRAIGGVMLGAAIAAAVFAVRRGRERVARPSRGVAALLAGSSLALAAIAVSLFKQTGFNPAMLIEQAAQVGSPLLLLGALLGSWSRETLSRLLRATVVLTFLGHGLYAIGFYPVPGSFIDMVIGILRVSEPEARVLLQVAGGMDLLVCALALRARWAGPALAYAVAWGLLTAFARPVAYLALGAGFESLPYWLCEALCRMPHAAVPLAAWLLQRRVSAGDAIPSRSSS